MDFPLDWTGGLIRGALGRRGKQRKGLERFLTGGSGAFLKTSLLIGAGAVAWELWRRARERSAGPVSTTVVVPRPVAHAPGGGASTTAPTDDTAPNLALAVTRLLVCAARVDGELGEEELEHLLENAREAGLEERMRSEWQAPRSLADVAAAFVEDEHRRDAYTLAYACLRADEDVNGAERVFLAQLAHHLELDPSTTERLEREAAAGIDRAIAGVP